MDNFKRIALMLIFLCKASITAEIPSKIFSLVERDPWNMVIGSESPSFALYNNGLLIFWSKNEKKEYKYFSVKLENAFFEELKIKLKIPNDSLKSEYVISNWTDQPTTEFNFYEKSISVYGFLPALPGKIKYKKLDKAEEAELQLRKQFPKELDDIFAFVKSYDNNSKKEWLPEYIEVMLWPFEYAKGKPLFWPKNGLI